MALESTELRCLPRMQLHPIARGRANMAHVKEWMPDPSLDFQVELL